MKRLFTRQTETENESLQKGNEFAKHHEEMSHYSQNCAMESVQRVMLKKKAGGFAYGGSAGAQKGWITEQQNFLKNAPLQVFNLTPNENG